MFVVGLHISNPLVATQYYIRYPADQAKKIFTNESYIWTFLTPHKKINSVIWEIVHCNNFKLQPLKLLNPNFYLANKPGAVVVTFISSCAYF